MNIRLSSLARLAATAAAIAVLLSASHASRAMHASDSPELTVVTNQSLTVSLQASFGMLQGESHELVYDYLEDGTRRKASDLIWDLSDVCMAGATASVRLGRIMHLNAGYWTSVTRGYGEMNDYDWYLADADWTHWSRSDVDVLSGRMVDVNMVIDFLELDVVTFSGIFGWKRDFWKWDEFSREYIYSVNGFRDEKGNENGEHMIDYEQWFDIPYLGMAAKCRLGNINANAYILCSGAVSAEDKDWHIKRKIHFKETFEGGSYLGIGAWSQYHLSDHVFVTGSMSWQLIPDIVGKMEATDDTTGEVMVSEAGAGISHYSSMLLVAIGCQF